MDKYQWFDFTRDESTDAIPDKYILTIADADGEEIAVIVHRTLDDTFPLDGRLAEKKRQDATLIVRALNALAESKMAKILESRHAVFHNSMDHYAEYDGQAVGVIGALPEAWMYRVCFIGGALGSVSANELSLTSGD